MLLTRSPPIAMPALVELSIIIPVFNCCIFTQKCLETLYSSFQFRDWSFDDFEVIVVDNASTDGTSRMLAEVPYPRLRSVRNGENLGFGRACNQAASIAAGRYLIFLNNDTEVLPLSFITLHNTIRSDPSIGIVGCRLLYPDFTIQHAGIAADSEGRWHHVFRGVMAEHPAVLVRRPFQAVTGACLIISKDLFETIGGFDDQFHNCHEDVDLCLAARALGKQVIYEPCATLIHHESQTEGRSDFDHHELLLKKWHGRFRFDFEEKTTLFLRRMAEGALRQGDDPSSFTAAPMNLWETDPACRDLSRRRSVALLWRLASEAEDATRLQREVLRLRENLAGLERILSSRSWRWTAPIRRLLRNKG